MRRRRSAPNKSKPQPIGSDFWTTDREVRGAGSFRWHATGSSFPTFYYCRHRNQREVFGTGTVYRVIGSKDELLDSIMESFGQKVEAGWVSVLRSDATPIEKLDALSWVNVNALDQFSDEFRIQLAWMRQSPPTANPGWSYPTRLRQMKSLLSEGIRSGEIRIDAPSTAMLARCVIGLQWIPENILRQIGKRAALVHVRDTVLRGAAVRGK